MTNLTNLIAEKPPKGEIVVLIGSVPERIINPETLELSLREALLTHSLRDAADLVSADLGVARRKVYQLALKLENEK